MRVATITLNPAVDQTILAHGLRLGQVNRAQSMVVNAGGKGVNVAAALADYGISVSATGLLGNENAGIYERFFARKGIEDRFIRIPGETRTNVKIVDEITRETTDINLPGLIPPLDAITMLLEELDQLAKDVDWFVLTGGIPPGVAPELCAQIIYLLKGRGRSVLLDTSGAALRCGLTANPDLIKPNLEELAYIAEYPLRDAQAAVTFAQQLLGDGIEQIVVSMGEQGALFISQKNTLWAVPPKVPAYSTVGAGDALVAGLIAGELTNLVGEDRARLAVAFSLASVTRVKPDQSLSNDIPVWIDQITFRQ